MTSERWQQITYWPLIIASLAFIIAYSWQVIADLGGTGYTFARVVMFATWVVFAVDYIVQLSLARPKGAWFRSHLFDLSVVVIPALRPLRLLKALTVIHVLQRTAGAALRARIAVYGAGAALTLIWVAALTVLEAERDAPDATITTFGDALWWAFVTITTVGYGDYTPVTSWGRIIAVLLMTGGIAVVGVVSATFASWVLEKAAAGADDTGEAATRGQIRALAAQIDDLAVRLGRPGGDPPSSDRPSTP
ncbi:MAG: ion transporter [Microbacterium sp.]|nr:ion transporter [Microbacterium sp.]